MNLKLSGIFKSPGLRNTSILVKVSITGFILIFTLNASLGIYSIFKISDNLMKSTETLNTARKTELKLQEQVLTWQNLLMEGENFERYKNHYHMFSYNAQDVQNLLFNLKLQLSDSPAIKEKIDNLRYLHQEITSEFTGHIVDMKQKNFRNADIKKEETRGREKEIITVLNEIVTEIEASSKKKADFTLDFHTLIVTLSFSIFITILIISGRKIGRLIVKTNAILEEMVLERTTEYMEANMSLEKEITLHKETEARLIESRNETEKMNRQLTVSEQKYRVIVEGTRDIIFTLDENFQFINANKAIKQELKINVDTVEKYNLRDIIYKNPFGNDLSETIIKEKFEQLKNGAKQVEFSAEFKTPNMIEPLELTVSLEIIETGGHNEILGKASRGTGDKTIPFFITEKCEYSITNQLLAADDISHKITDNLTRYIPRNEINLIRMALREIIINSIEHGNLNITYEEKSKAMLMDRYIALLNERQKDPANSPKRVKIEYLISDTRAVYKITDQGKGFNHKKILAMGSDSANESLLPHGRGITITTSVFNEVKYNLRGNQVLLVKYLK